MKNAILKKRILEISYKYKLSHLGSCITACDIIDEIYSIKKPDEPFILSSGHAGLALYCVIEKYGGKNAEDIFLHHGVHPDKCVDCGVYCSSGSLGHGLPIAVGMALSERTKNVYCLISDGEVSEGSIREALTIRRNNNINNLIIYCNANGYGAYSEIVVQPINNAITVNTNFDDFPFLKGQDAHYHVMTKEEYDSTR